MLPPRTEEDAVILQRARQGWRHARDSLEVEILDRPIPLRNRPGTFVLSNCPAELLRTKKAIVHRLQMIEPELLNMFTRITVSAERSGSLYPLRDAIFDLGGGYPDETQAVLELGIGLPSPFWDLYVMLRGWQGGKRLNVPPPPAPPRPAPSLTYRSVRDDGWRGFFRGRERLPDQRSDDSSEVNRIHDADMRGRCDGDRCDTDWHFDVSDCSVSSGANDIGDCAGRSSGGSLNDTNDLIAIAPLPLATADSPPAAQASTGVRPPSPLGAAPPLSEFGAVWAISKRTPPKEKRIKCKRKLKNAQAQCEELLKSQFNVPNAVVDVYLVAGSGLTGIKATSPPDWVETRRQHTKLLFNAPLDVFLPMVQTALNSDGGGPGSPAGSSATWSPAGTIWASLASGASERWG